MTVHSKSPLGRKVAKFNAKLKKLGTSEVSHPSHYNQGKIEVIEFIEDQQLCYHLGNTVKYVARAKHKGREIQDLEKARWYLDRKIALLKGNAPRPNDMVKR